MKVLLVTTTFKLADKLAALSPELEYCAAVVDNVEPAKEIFANVGLSQVPLYPMNELQKCVESLRYDYVLRVQDNYYGEKIIREIKKYTGTENKIMSFAGLHTDSNFKVDRALRYFGEHAQDFKMFATGTSTAWAGLDATKFKYKLFNLAKPSQDLYYDYNVAKHVILCGGGIVRYVMLSSVLRRILFTMICRWCFITGVSSCRISLPSMTCITSSCPPTIISNFSVRNG